MKLTDRQKASGLTLTDIVHVVLINDTIQDPNGSSYKADMQQIIDLVPKYWTSGSTGTFAIKAVNDSGIDATGDYAVASGYNTLASELYSFAEGHNTTAMGQASHAEGQNTTASGEASHVEGYLTVATDFGAHAEGVSTAANGYSSHAEGYNTTANGSYSHAEGQDTLTVGDNSHAEGYLTQANGSHSHAEGTLTIANGHASHAEGLESQANGEYSHAGGQNSTASGQTSFVHGDGSYANGTNTIVFGANIVGTDADKTYVDAFNIKTVGATTSIYNLGYDSAGNVVIGNDKFISGLTFNNTTYVLTANRNDGVNFSQDLTILASDVKVTGGTYNPSTGVVNFTNNSGGTFNVSGFTAGYTSPITIVNTSNLFSTGLVGSGVNASAITNSNFFGENAGYQASAASNSNFLGADAGYNATGASFSNFLGNNAGQNASGASFSTLIGYSVGKNSTGTIGSNNIIIGKNISLSAGTTDSINIGGVLFGTGTYSATTGNPSTSGQTNGRIGVNVVAPTTALHISSDTADTSGLRLERLTSTSPTSAGQPIGVDSSGNVVAVGNLQKTISASYTATSADNNYTILINNGGSAINITIPSGLLTKINIGFIQQGSGDVTMAAGAGVTINTPIVGGYKIKGINYNAYLEQVGSSDVYQLLGNLKV